MALGDIIASLSVQLGIDSAAFEKGSARSGKQAKDLGDRMEKMGNRVGTAIKGIAVAGAAMGGAFIVNQVKEMATSGLDFASSLGEQAQQLGLTVSELQRYRYVATQVGIEQAEMDKGLSRLSIALGDLRNGAKGPTEAMQRLGLSQTEIARVSKMTAGEAIPVLADAFAKLKSPTEQSAVAADIFGAKLGPKFITLLAGGRSEIDKLTASYKNLGIELSADEIAKADELADKMASLQEVIKAKQAKAAVGAFDTILKGTEAWEGFKIKMLEVAANSASAWDSIEKHTTAFSEAVKRIDAQLGIMSPKEFTASISKNFSESWKRISDFFTGIYNFTVKAPGWIANMVSQIGASMGSKLSGILDGAKAKFGEVTKAAFDMWDRVTRRSYVPDMISDIAHEMAKLDSVMVDRAVAATGKTKAAFQKLRDELKPIMDRLFPEVVAKNTYDREAGAIDNGRKLGGNYASWAETMERLNRERLSSSPSNDNEPGAMAGIDMAPFVDMKVNMEGLSAAVAASIPNLQGLSGTLMQIGFDGEEVRADLSSAFTDIVLRSRNAKEALGSVFDRLAAKLLDKGFDSLLGGLFGGIGKIFGFATGTPSAPSGLHLVGERGPELVDFRGGERVIPNGSSRMGGSTNVTVEIVDTTGLFITRVNGQIAQFSPAIADAGGRVGANNLRKSSRRSLAA